MVRSSRAKRRVLDESLIPPSCQLLIPQLIPLSDFTFFCILGDCQRPQKAIRSEDDQPKYERDLYCVKQIYKYILEAEEGEVRDIKVEDFVVRNLESFNVSLAALSSSACSKLETVATVLTCIDTPTEQPLSRIPSMCCMRLFCLVSDEFPWMKCRSLSTFKDLWHIFVIGR